MPLPTLNKYCKRCGAKLITKDAAGYWVCDNCGWTDNPVVSPLQTPSPEETPVLEDATRQDETA